MQRADGQPASSGGVLKIPSRRRGQGWRRWPGLAAVVLRGEAFADRAADQVSRGVRRIWAHSALGAVAEGTSAAAFLEQRRRAHASLRGACLDQMRNGVPPEVLVEVVHQKCPAIIITSLSVHERLVISQLAFEVRVFDYQRCVVRHW